jgi:uncharacterized protein (DUF1330 family)
MPAYVIAQLEVTDPAAYERYRAASPATISAAGGRYLARGGEVTALEGAHDGRRVVILEFPDLRAARDWYHGESYREARELRRHSARNVTFLLVPGVG